MIVFKDWTISASGEILARQHDNLSRTLLVSGELPENWDWTMLVQVGDAMDIITLEPMEGGVGVVLTAEQLALAGYYRMQLRGARGEEVRHTNVVSVFVPDSLSGDGQWPVLPSEFSQAEARINEAADRAEAASERYPKVGANSNWWIWDVDAGAYVDTGIYSGGEAPYIGADDHWYVGNRDTGVPANGRPGPVGSAATLEVAGVETLEAGQPAEVINEGTSGAAKLRFKIPAGVRGKTGATPEISMEVTQLAAGAQPTVSVDGPAERPVIQLGIPAGEQGETGATPNISIGTVETLPAGTDVTAGITGQTPNLVLDLGIPRGHQGDRGIGLPPVTEADNGKVATVVDGAWGLVEAGAAGYLPLVATAELTEDVSSITVSTDNGGNPLYLYEMVVDIRAIGGSGNGDGAANRSTAGMYLNESNTAVQRKTLGVAVPAAGMGLGTSFYARKLETGYYLIRQGGYSQEDKASAALNWVNSGDQNNGSNNVPNWFNAVTVYCETEGKTFGAGTKIKIFGR